MYTIRNVNGKDIRLHFQVKTSASQTQCKKKQAKNPESSFAFPYQPEAKLIENKIMFAIDLVGTQTGAMEWLPGSNDYLLTFRLCWLSLVYLTCGAFRRASRILYHERQYFITFSVYQIAVSLGFKYIVSAVIRVIHLFNIYLFLSCADSITVARLWHNHEIRS